MSPFALDPDAAGQSARSAVAHGVFEMRGISGADYLPRSCRPAYRDECRQHLVRPVEEPGVLRPWFRFSDNSGLDWDHYGRVDYLYVSHLHQDHFDPGLLADHVSRAATVLTPDFPVPDLRDQLER